jgi:hypothetical protein
MAQPPHEMGVVDLADRVVVGFLGLLLFFFGHSSGEIRLSLPLYRWSERGISTNAGKERSASLE